MTCLPGSLSSNFCSSADATPTTSDGGSMAHSNPCGESKGYICPEIPPGGDLRFRYGTLAPGWVRLFSHGLIGQRSLETLLGNVPSGLEPFLHPLGKDVPVFVEQFPGGAV